MPQVDFYVLTNRPQDGRLALACRVIEKAYSRGHRIYVNAESRSQAIQLDELLWTFRQSSFIPHALGWDELADEAPVLIGHERDPERENDVLINFSPTVPEFFERFARVAEVVEKGGDPSGRERYRYYRERGYSPATHKLAL